ncbi:aldose 1-epimerase family protein [Treponema sp. Marseille-Q4132]|uniref:aldose 1-epimerase family protein n=1 Tax=Treponema sp. Marseille-Q4132 TaxID=2766701 RepID=UPI001653179D|nr:aldose 1-epimerase family protein [Treponema sp. Marseille-Q4132]QNL98024.1 aldose 1-epimerase family protein [Treponema sp. Marseille-Q4132]
MQYEISNGVISIAAVLKGAELVSLKKSGTEYLWQADSVVWNRSAPNLFPFVGKLNGGVYRFEGKTYPMTPHGFARDVPFALSKRTDTYLRFALSDTDETRKVYPFPFLFEITYTITGSTLTQTWRVTNTGKSMMYFSLGAHPGFMCPGQGGKLTDWTIRFSGDKKIDRVTARTINAAGLVQEKTDSFSLSDGTVRVTDDMFSHDALIFEKSGVKAVTLLDKSKKEFVRVDFDTDVFGLWSPQERGAPFLCIEPWYGRCDLAGFSGELSEREWGNSLPPSAVFEKSFSITLF